MKTPIAALVALACAFAGPPALAQGGGKAKVPYGQQIRYFDLSASIFSELSAEAILKETRQGTTIVSAELEVCHQTEPGSNRLDRFVVPLKVEGNRMSGTAQSQEDKQSVTVNLVRRIQGAGKYAYEGSVNNGKYLQKVVSADNAEISEQDFTERYLSEDELEAAPADFINASPQSLLVRIGRNGLTGLLDSLRDQNVRIVYNGLASSCRVLKNGQHTVQIDLDAERAAAVLARIKSIPAVTAAGYLVGSQDMQRAIRFPSAGWRDATGKLDRDKFTAALRAAVGEALWGAVDSSAWDDRLGELTIVVKRPDETVAGLKLAQLITVKLMVAPETPASRQNSILWIESITAQILDERPAPRLEFYISVPADTSEEQQQSSEPEGSDALAEELATALKGTAWDSDEERWPK